MDLHTGVIGEPSPDAAGLLRPLYATGATPLAEGLGGMPVPASVSGADSVFGPPMTDAEAASIAAGPFMGFPTASNDMRVSI